MIIDLKGQTAVVTGGTRGIGRAASEGLLQAGASVVAVYRGGDGEAGKFRAAASELAGNLETQKLDVADYDACEEFFRNYEKNHDSLEILVNCAGVRRDSIVGMMKKDDWRQVVDINLTGTFNMCKFAVQAMMKNRYGRIVSITSPVGRLGIPGQANYGASKAGQVGLARSLSKEVASRNITVNCVSPGFIDTDFIGDLPEATRKEYTKTIPMKRFGAPGDVAGAVVFLASGQAGYITGATLEVSGGL